MEIYDRKHCGVTIIKNALSNDDFDKVSKFITSQKEYSTKLPYYFNTTIQDMNKFDLSEVHYELTSLMDIYNNHLEQFGFDKLPYDKINISVNYYQTGSKGISPHRDFTKSTHLIMIYVLKGKNDFCVATDKDRNNEIRFPAYDNSIILMRGPRSKEENDLRPIHYVENIIEERISILFRIN